MYELRSIESLCSQLKHPTSCNKDKSNKDLNCLLINFTDILTSLQPCDSGWLPVLYWYSVILSGILLISAATEFYGIFVGTREPSSIRQCKYFVISDEWQRNLRLIGSGIMSLLNFSLLLGLLLMSPGYITPWMRTQAILLGLEVMSWIIDILFYNECVSAQTFAKYFLLYISWKTVWCMKNIFHKKNQGFSPFKF